MLRTLWVALLGLLFAIPAIAADDTSAAGKWKIVVMGQGGQAFWLINFESKDGKWDGKVNDVYKSDEGGNDLENLALLENVAVDKGSLSFELSNGRDRFKFTGKLPKGSGRKLFGTLEKGKILVPVMLEGTEVTTFADLPKETIASAQPGDAEVTGLVLALLGQAAEKKSKPEEVRGWAEKAFKCAEPFGANWQREVALRCAEALLEQKGFEAAALENARRAERLIEDKDEADLQLRTYKTLVRAMKAAGKTDNIKEYNTKLVKLEEIFEAAYVKKMIDFTPDAFKGRKEKSDRTVVVELFTGSECPPCVGADLAFEVLGKTFKPTEVILLQYHLHVPRPDPLVHASTEARADYYEKAVRGTPTILFNGKDAPGGGGRKEDAKKKYEEYRTVIEPLLEKPALAKLKASATLKDNAVSITAEASDLDQTGEQIRLRLVLVEEKVRFDGGNGIQIHHHVVRDMPGGAEGIALKEKTGKQTVTVELDDLRKQTNKFLDGVRMDFSSRPLDYHKLHVVAFVQNDKTKEILQATQVEVEQK